MSSSSPFRTRRTILAGGLALAAFPAGAAPAGGNAMIAGTYAREGGKGLYPLRPQGTEWTVGEPIPTIANISFGVRSARHGLVYLVSEAQQGSVGAYDNAFRALATRPTLGAGPCYIALSPDQSALAIANYSSGTVALLPLDSATGLPQGDGQSVQHEGHGPNAGRQAGPHAHWVGFSPDGRWLHSVDLGADAIFLHPIDAKTRRLGTTEIAFRAPPGSGPRHLARHPRLPIAYLVSELANTLTVLGANPDGRFRSMHVQSTLPAGFSGASQAAHIAVNAAGTRLYVSNRGHNSIAVFALAADGGARLIQHVDSGGNWPRFFLLNEARREMLVANERSGTIVRFAVDRDGQLQASGTPIAVPGVVFLALT